MPWSLEFLLQVRGPLPWHPQPALPLEDREHAFHPSYSLDGLQMPGDIPEEFKPPEFCLSAWEMPDFKLSANPWISSAGQCQQLPGYHLKEVLVCLLLGY